MHRRFFSASGTGIIPSVDCLRSQRDDNSATAINFRGSPIIICSTGSPDVFLCRTSTTAFIPNNSSPTSNIQNWRSDFHNGSRRTGVKIHV
jgi:hypothetical protein